MTTKRSILIDCFILVTLIISLPQCSLSQYRTFSPGEVREDIDFMFDKMEEVHPNLYYAVPRKNVVHEKERLLAGITGPLSRKDICRIFTPLVSSLNDGHTSLRFPEMDLMQYTQRGGLFFPAAVSIIDSRIYVKSSRDGILPPGNEIISINGKAAAEILEVLKNYVSGEKLMYREARMSHSFAALYWLVLQDSQEFSIRVSDEEGKKSRVNIQGVVSPDLDGSGKLDRTARPDYEYRELDGKTGLIEFRSFSDRKAFGKFLTKTFTRIRKSGIEDLIINIRENGGGNSSLGDDLIGYIYDKPYSQIDKMLVKLSDDVIEDGWGSWMDQDTLEKYRGIVYTSPRHMRDPGHNELRFTGRVYLLTGPDSFSSANMFASAFKCYGMGTIIGEETGGLTVSYGDVRSYRLPNTRISFGCSFKQFFEACGSQNGRGVIPDHRVESGGSSDPVLEYTLDLIKRDR